jgi:hypothetical protein
VRVIDLKANVVGIAKHVADLELAASGHLKRKPDLFLATFAIPHRDGKQVLTVKLPFQSTNKVEPALARTWDAGELVTDIRSAEPDSRLADLLPIQRHVDCADAGVRDSPAADRNKSLRTD